MSVDLLHLNRYEPLFQSIATMFNDGWDTSDAPLPYIQHIFYVKHLSPYAQAHLQNYSRYSNQVGNVQYLFHGTQRSCRTGDQENWTQPCYNSDCFLCSILRCSFNLSLAGSQNGKMFGNGIYTTLTSSKAANYALSTDRGSNNRVIMLSNVAVGQSCKMYSAASYLDSPPPGYHSITGATYSEGGVLKHPETIVYRQDAICVSAVVVYS